MTCATPEPGMTLEQSLERQLEAGRISADDVAEVLNFAAFLTRVGPVKGGTREQRIERLRALRDHYPEDWAALLREHPQLEDQIR